MSDILSQEEIDALLTSMNNGEVDIEQDKDDEVHVEPYDLTSKDIMLHDQFHALKEIIDKFTKLACSSISSALQKRIDVKTSATEMIKFGEFINGFSGTASFTVFDMDPLSGSALLAIEPNLVFSMIDCMFGGDGKELGKPRDFTLIEQRLIQKMAMSIIGCLEEAWALVCPIKTSLKKSETRPDFVNLYSPTDFVLIMVFSIEHEAFTGNINFCIPYFMLEPIKEKLSARYIVGATTETKWNAQLYSLFNSVKVDVIAELGRAKQITGNDLLALKSGDILQLDTRVYDPLTVTVESVPKYLGMPGIVGGNRAIQITNRLEREE